MAEGEKQASGSYPAIPARIWWQLRSKAKKSPPSEITAGYLSIACGVTEKAAANMIMPLRRVGLIEKEGNGTTDRLLHWRDDESYAQVCSQILNELYPKELRDLLPPPDPDRTQAERWFARKTGTGESASKQMAAFYALLAKADPSDADATKDADNGAPRARTKPTPKAAPRATAAPAAEAKVEVPEVHGRGRSPTMHIDIQIHISPQATPEQIDTIFASMSKHLYRNQA